MGDMFDEFMKELRRRQAEAAGKPPPDEDGESAEGDPGEGDTGEGDGADADAGASDHDGGADGSDELAGDDEEPAGSGPRPISSGPRRRSPRGRRGFGPRPPGPRPPRGAVGGPNDGAGSSVGRRVVVGIAIVAAVFLVLMLVVGIEFWTDAIWYRSVGFDDVFWTRIRTQALLFVGAGALTLVVLLGSVWLAGRLAPPIQTDGGGAGEAGPAGRRPGRRSSGLREFLERLNEAAANAEINRTTAGGRQDPFGRRPESKPIDVTPLEMPDPVPIGRTIIVALAILIAIGVAGSVAANWDTILLWANRVPFAASGAAVTDPVFGKDISFFLFELPFFRFLQSEVVGLLVVLLILTGARYVLASLAGGAVFGTAPRVHLGVLAGLFLMAIALGYQLDKFELVYSDRGIATGVSYTDATAQFLAFDVLTGLSAIAAALLVGGAFARVLWPVGLTLAVWFIASNGIGRLYPAAVQQFTVVPNQLAQEQQYIANNIAMTRLAFDIGDWVDRSYAGNAVLTPDAITADQDTFDNARLWDYRPLGDTLDQIQTVRQYYDFTDVDTDRYQFGDKIRQVMLSARELALDKNPNATGWVNERVTYTHGIGVAMVPVNEVASQGQPRLVIANLPPVSTAGAPPITEPRIYFGERDSSYVVVGARQQEFDYPRGQTAGGADVPVETRWTGKTGIKLDTNLSRLLFALRFRDLNLLISDQITSDSQLLFHRSLADRLPRIAGFLRFDKDPYVVIDGQGRLKYVQDAFTTSDRFPHAQEFQPSQLPGSGLGGQPFNYIRNSVKIVNDAYDGSMTFYVADPSDPLIRAWQAIFPTLFHPLDELPTDLRPHLRVPEELFNVQTRVFGRYHVTDTPTFYFNNDLWTVPVAQTNTQILPSEAYYVVMRIPGTNSAEFLLLQPMIPKDRPNMIAWVAVRNDGQRYGETQVFRFPSDSSIFGPAQVEAQIDADPEISAQITLWDQSGSQVVRGNLIVVPVNDSLIYLQPVYLRSRSAKFPAFERIVVASPTNVVWGSTLKEALDRLLAEQGGGTPTPTPTPSPTPSASGPPGPSSSPGTSLPSDVAALIEYANQHFELAQQALHDEDFARYGEELALVKSALAQLRQLTGPGGSAAPSPTP